MMTTRIMTSVGLILLLSIPSTTLGYAAWLKCYIELDDADEVIMGNKIAAFDTLDETQQVFIEVKEKEGDGTWMTEYDYPVGTATSLVVRLKFPEQLDSDPMQFALDIGEGGKISNGGMCDNKRAIGNSAKTEVAVEIDGLTDSVKLWGGWATGYSKVRMTHKLVLNKQKGDEEF
eukprot:CAMPEP_0202445352 /NCGR_PEP_ID=MMETSP1360-20130828/4191_1 /ASSEMBLY_ACC=CAM_ASM_000848 /TAXON_ID=515479 /ORGANISM="Licmophora paradoxa, Strain CCMP2313" /LENGTH=174 /DNA_ID=CAMNT_0049061583 /DNA_START=14 /DNA_END=538 /DNA_ORIENTATION=+